MAAMQGFNFGIRDSATPSIQSETQSRYIPSSVYSGPGPAEEYPLPPQPQQQYVPNGQRRPSQNSVYTGADQRYYGAPLRYRNSTTLNMNDPVAMHLLMETAIIDSKDFEILSFEELEDLKRRRGFLRTKVDGARRQLGLEKKMYEAAHSLTKLYSDDDRLNPHNDPKQKRSSFFGRRSSSAAKGEGELDTGLEKIEKLTANVKSLEDELQTVERRIIQHTAGILQHTHRGLKKNLRKNELPRSPESMASQPRSLSNTDGISDFDERSLYQVPDYVHEYQQSTASRSSRRITKEIQPIEDVAIRLHTLNTQLHGMLQQLPLPEYFEPPPEPTDGGLHGRVGAQIQAHLTYMSQGLEALDSVKESATQTSPAGLEEQIQALTSTLHGMLERTNSVSKSPSIGQDGETGKDLRSQLAYSASVLDRLNQRVDALLEQKEILTRQIQQQRELNTKSDAQRDAHISDLTEELEEAKNLQAISDKEMQQSQDQIVLLMEQLDQAKQGEQLMEKQRGMQDNKALEAERAARRETETRLLQELEAKQKAFTELQAAHETREHDFELKLQNHTQQLNVLTAAKGQAELELNSSHENYIQQLNELTAAREQAELELRSSHDNHVQQFNELTAAKQRAELELTSSNEKLGVLQAEMQELETQVVTFQTELTMAKAELDGAYGSRAQRAADVSMNPEIKKQIDDLKARNADLEQQLDFLSQEHETKGAGSAELQNKVNSLQKELKDTIEDYEVMTKASIEFEKERDELEATIDSLKEKCETLDAQINEDKVKWLGAKSSLPPETTSTMVLKNEFKKMVRDSRAESMKTLRVCLARLAPECTMLTRCVG